MSCAAFLAQIASAGQRCDLDREMDIDEAHRDVQEKIDSALAALTSGDEVVRRGLMVAKTFVWLDQLDDLAAALKTVVTLAETSPVVKPVERAVRDLFVIRCRSIAPPCDRTAFLQVAKEALGGSMGQHEESLILLSYRKRCAAFLGSFHSKNEQAFLRRGFSRKRRQRDERRQ